MGLDYLVLNFLVGAGFFFVSAVIGVVLAFKLKGRWKSLPLILFVTVGCGTGFCMMGQFWYDMIHFQAWMASKLPTENADVTVKLTKLARRSLENHYAAQGTGDEKTTFVLDMVYPVYWRLDKGILQATISFLVPDGKVVYVDCSQHQEDAWHVDRIYHKQFINGQVEKRVCWSRH